MMSALKKLVLHYLREVSVNEYSDEDLEYMSSRFVEDVERLVSARADFKEVE